MMTEEQRLINETLKTSREYLTEQAEFTVERLKEYDKCSERMFALIALEYMRLAALTQPASPALKLPDGWVAVPMEPTEEMIVAWRDDMDKSYAKEHAIKIGEDEIVFAHQAMLAAAPDAPHTAPIEPICATGGAEWVSNDRVEEIIYRAEMFGHGAGYLPDEVIPLAKELLALRKAFSEPYGWITEYPSIPAGIGGMTYSFHDNRQDAQDEAEAYDGFAVAVIRKP